MRKTFSHSVEHELGTGDDRIALELRQVRMQWEVFLSRNDLMRLVAVMVKANTPPPKMIATLAMVFLEADPQRPTN